ncbi:hypothetical protein [Actinoplanes sp. NPDC051859]|uniref:hypothetical protein n=1 Tax=Actinoplanes sp. NPDC051859 TaxID=3363909 RepID=UPI0037AF31AE
MRNHLLDNLKRRHTTRHQPSTRRGKVRRTSRDAAARILRTEDDHLLGLPAQRLPKSTLIDHYPQR